jgi:uncharacterized protein YndB with AHSA1/START domain
MDIYLIFKYLRFKNEWSKNIGGTYIWELAITVVQTPDLTITKKGKIKKNNCTTKWLYYICNQIVVYMGAKPEIKIDTFIEATPDEVWEAITDKALISQWLMETNIEPIVGFNGYFKMKPTPLFNGQIESTVIEVKPTSTFTFTWTSSWMKVPTTIKFSLQEKENGTLLTLEHWGFKGLRGFLLKKMLGGGWKKLITIKIPKLIKDRQ